MRFFHTKKEFIYCWEGNASIVKCQGIEVLSTTSNRYNSIFYAFLSLTTEPILYLHEKKQAEDNVKLKTQLLLLRPEQLLDVVCCVNLSAV